MSLLLLLCLSVGAFTQSLTDAQKIDQAIALVQGVTCETDACRTRQKDVSTRLGTFKTYLPASTPVPPPPPPVYVTQSVFDALVARVAKLEGGTVTPPPVVTLPPVVTPPPVVIPPPPPSTEANGYWNGMVQRADHWKSFSLRDPAQLQTPNNGGYAHANSRELVVTYDPAMDAAKVVIPAGVNSLTNQVRLPLVTADGTTYLFTWDGYWTDSYLPVRTQLTNHKAFQFASGGDDIWLEPQTRFDGGRSTGRPAGFDPTIHVAGIEVRSYNVPGGPTDYALSTGSQLGPGITHNQPIEPKLGAFILWPNRWTRFWVRIEQRANDYDYVDVWVADEQQNPVQLYARVPVSVRNGTIDKFWLEFNTSTTEVAAGRGAMVAYVKNFLALKNPPADVSALLQKPVR